MKGARRLDLFLVESGLVPSRGIAQSLILRGDILVDDEPVTKAGASVTSESAVRLRTPLPKFVGRGGEKLESALGHFSLSVEGTVGLDIGASTGGFTDCLLQHGATLVYAVDVGRNQLVDSLRRDPRVCSLEETHANELHPGQFDPLPDFVTVDVSFISIRKVLLYVVPCLRVPFRGLLLVKPQFELGRERVEKGGVVRRKEDQLEAVGLVEEFLRKDLSLRIFGHFACPLVGAKKGNQEYFISIGS